MPQEVVSKLLGKKCVCPPKRGASVFQKEMTLFRKKGNCGDMPQKQVREKKAPEKKNNSPQGGRRMKGKGIDPLPKRLAQKIHCRGKGQKPRRKRTSNRRLRKE